MAFSPLRATDYPYLFSGAMLVFETEVMELCHRDLYYVEKVGPGTASHGQGGRKSGRYSAG